MKTFLITTLLLAGTWAAQAQTLAPDAFEQQLRGDKNAQLIDVRTPGEFGGGHLPKSTNIDFRNPDFARNVTQLDKSKPVYVYCLSGGRSAEAAKLLREQGYANVYELQGGYLKWTTKLKPVEGVKADASAKAVTPDQLKAIVKGNRLVLVDFYAPWCAPCQKMMPIIDQLQTQYGGKLQVVKADADASKALLQAWQVEEIPTLLLVKDGKLTQRLVGLQTEATLHDLIASHAK